MGSHSLLYLQLCELIDPGGVALLGLGGNRDAGPGMVDPSVLHWLSHK